MAHAHAQTPNITPPIGAHIARTGPVSIAEFMALALTHPTWGYYSTHKPLGRDGDFVTAPDISQIFGELLGVWCADIWHKLGKPTPFTLLDLGGGRGTLLADALRAADTQVAFRNARRPVILEHSRVLRAEQKRRVPDASWLTDLGALADLPPRACLVLANEFLDALPIRQFCWQHTRWQERYVTWQNGQLEFCLRDSQLPPDCIQPDTPPNTGDILEHASGAHALLQQVGKHLLRYGGAALYIDYGSLTPCYGDSLQAVQAHAPCAPLAHPGQCDISAHVNFAALAQWAHAIGCATTGPITQRQFLRHMGADMRAAALAKNQPAAQQEIYAGLARLLHPDAMGVLFKVMAVHPPGLCVEGFM